MFEKDGIPHITWGQVLGFKDKGSFKNVSRNRKPFTKMIFKGDNILSTAVGKFYL